MPDDYPVNEIRITDCGTMPYREAWSLQSRLNEGVRNGTEQETILIVEHAPVYTLGFHADAGNMLLDEQRLRAIGAECIRIERGGDVTFHGPGQVVAYPIISLPNHHLGVKQYVSVLEEAVIETIAEWGLTGERIEGKTGVWVKGYSGVYRKICAIGIKVRRGVTMHGLALNVSTDLRWFGNINPCGFSSDSVTSMMESTGDGGGVMLSDVKRVLAERLKNLLYRN
ncbi:MAG: lipoyl(octanoyl) transferase LipB [Muribaculaceae bacterium]|nr:lipoyl(octanoyl) transferase LipB [Muribaculaceae bacterium]